MKSYKELIMLPTFEDRFEYLQLKSYVGHATFGVDRYLNQNLYRSWEWKQRRNDILLRDNGCDLGIEGREIYSGPIIHHITPITIEDLEMKRKCVFDPDNLITVMETTHRAIHFGNASHLVKLPIERRKGDTCPWIL